MPIRKLTSGEKLLLQSVFSGTLPYDAQEIDWNEAEWGGRTNSITFGIVPHMAVPKWSLDYSASSVPDDHKRTFVHEMAHVWHWYHGGSNIRSWMWTGLAHLLSGYANSYYYDLADSGDITDFNFEQQASIISDYWFVKQGHSPVHNNGTNKSVADYQPFINQVQSSGPPQDLSHNVKYANRSGSRPL